MAIGPTQVLEIDSVLSRARADSKALASLRQLTPGIAVTLCDQIDMRDETPFRIYESVSLYLIDGRDHCWKITNDPRCATGMVLAANGGAP